MHVCFSVYHFQSGTANESLEKARETAYPIYRKRPGFVAYELFLTGADSGIGVTTWETRTQAEAAVAVDDQCEDFDAHVRRLTGGRGVTVAYDHIGAPTFERTFRCLARRATFVYYGMSSRRAPPFDLNRLGRGGSQFMTRPTMFDYLVTREERLWRSRTVFGWIAGGKVKLRIDHRFPLAEAPRAQVALATRQTTGKVILLPSP